MYFAGMDTAIRSLANSLSDIRRYASKSESLTFEGECRLLPGLIQQLSRNRLYQIRTHFSLDPIALKSAVDGSEAALFGFEAALQGLDHFTVGMEVLEVHVE